MKFLLTSAGLSNERIKEAAVELVGRQPEDTNVLFIPTAANMEVGDKRWVIKDLVAFDQGAYKEIDIVDIAAVPKDVWLPRCGAADIICVGGGNTQFLARVVRETGFAAEIQRLLETRVYMGISAGSMVACSTHSQAILEAVYEDRVEKVLEPTLNLVPIHFMPHLGSAYFPRVNADNVKSITGLVAPLYALDDQTALSIVDSDVTVVGGGEYVKV